MRLEVFFFVQKLTFGMPDNKSMASSTNWDKIRVEYISGEVPLRHLAKKYKLAPSVVSKHSKEEGWVMQRAQHRAEVGASARARIAEEAAAEQVRLFESARTAVNKMIELANKLAEDPTAFNKHIVTKSADRERWQEAEVLPVFNGRNFSDVAKGLSAITGIARLLDGAVDAATREKLDLEKERLELDRRKAGMSDDLEQESGIALLPAVDESLLADALPDPGQQAAE